MTYATSAQEARELGHKLYYSGKECRHGHVAWRRARSGDCRQCEYERNKKYQEDNPDQCRAYRREWARKDYAENPERHRKSARDAYYKNRENVLQRNREWCADNREHRNEYRRYRLHNIPGEAEKNRERARQWAKDNHDRAIQHSRNREREAEGTHTVADVRRLYDFQNGRCAACSEKLDDYHVDHVIPLAAGGSNYPDNLQILCPTCNASKGAKDPIEWARQNGRLI